MADVPVKKSGQAEKPEQAVQHAAPGRALSPWEEMEMMFERMFPRRWLQSFQREWPSFELGMPFEGRTPRVDLIDRENELVVRAEIPGVKKEDLEVTLGDNTITVRGTTSVEKKEEKGDYFRQEISSGTFSRTLGLPSEVDGSKAKASYQDGVLEVTLPKAAGAKRRKIAVE